MINSFRSVLAAFLMAAAAKVHPDTVKKMIRDLGYAMIHQEVQEKMRAAEHARKMNDRANRS